ncbi:MAG: helix-turn-helix transcriptional regulator [Clostridia bacterium]|nr:helix-turn-helix transcriptional regulator [Clostridia bacterium]
MENNSMGKLIQSLRKEKGLTQKQLADKLNITDKAVSKWERNVACPDISLLPKLSEILGVSVNDLLNVNTYSEEYAEKDIGVNAPDNNITDEDFEEAKEQEYQQCFSNFVMPLVFSGIAFIVVVFLFSAMHSDLSTEFSFSWLGTVAFAGFCFSGIPSGWKITSKWFDGWVIVGIGAIFVLILRVILACIIGWIALPIQLSQKAAACYSAAKFVKNRTSAKTTSALLLAILIYLAVLGTSIVAVGCNAFFESIKSGEESDSSPKEALITAADVVNEPDILFAISQDSLNKMLADESDSLDCGWKITTSSKIHGVFFAQAIDPSNPSYVSSKHIYLYNAVFVISGYYVEEGSGISLNAWEIHIDIYPNFKFNEKNELIYNEDKAYVKSIRANSIEEAFEIMHGSYSNMTFTDISAKQQN